VLHAADIQDRDGGVLVMATLFGMYPFLRKLYADGGYQGPQFQTAMQRVVRHVNVAALERQVNQTQAGYAYDVLKDLSEAEQKSASLAQQYAQAAHKAEQTVLRAPIDGTVQGRSRCIRWAGW
jgi:multidrug resistance efflux pump